MNESKVVLFRSIVLSGDELADANYSRRVACLHSSFPDRDDLRNVQTQRLCTCLCLSLPPKTHGSVSTDE